MRPALFFRVLQTLAALFLLGACALMVGTLVWEWISGQSDAWSEELTLFGLGLSFIIGSVCALWNEAHVGIGLFYARFQPRTTRRIFLGGVLLCLLPWCVVWIWSAVGTPTSFVRLSWQFMERSHQTGGMGGIFVFKTLVVLLPIVLIITALVMVFSRLRRRTRLHREV